MTGMGAWLMRIGRRLGIRGGLCERERDLGRDGLELAFYLGIQSVSVPKGRERQREERQGGGGTNKLLTIKREGTLCVCGAVYVLYTHRESMGKRRWFLFS